MDWNATTFIAAIVAFIAFLQWHTANQKIKVDLLDKRTNFYNEILSLLDKAFIDNEVKDNEIFFRLRRTSRIFFSDSVYRLIDNIGDTIFMIQQKSIERRGLSVEELNKSHNSFVELKKKMRNEYTELNNLMLQEMRPELWSIQKYIDPKKNITVRYD